MSEEEESAQEEAPEKPSGGGSLMISVIIAVVLAAAVAGIVFFSPVGKSTCDAPALAEHEGEKKTKSYEDIAFVNLEPLVITLGPNAKAEFLKISISLETTQDQIKAAEHLKPRFRDVLNTYLRAVDETDLAEPAAMTRVRAQMLRRLQVAASSDIVADVLITEFVLN